MSAPQVGRVESVERHRNGVEGEPFHVVRFIGHEADGEAAGRRFVAVLFDGPGLCAVLDREDLAAGDELSRWRGGTFEGELRAACRKWSDSVFGPEA